VGRVVYVDRFGNLISNITPLHLKEARGKTGRSAVTIRIAGVDIEDLVPAYEAGSTTAPHALINSNGQLEIFLKQGSAADMLNARSGARIEVR
jgi:S-adenosylmethionine hydrolase